jgi:sugar/nucleoside kinase (ribokinase family)
MIISFGNPVYDYIETPAITTGERVLSGGSTNGCLALTRLGHATTLVGRVGQDYGDRFETEIARYGITPIVQRCDQTGGFSLIYDAYGNRTLDVLGIADPIESIPATLADAQAVVVAPILQETPLSLIERIRAATTAPLLLDPQGLLRRIGATQRIEHFLPETFASTAPLFQVIKANEVEAHILTGIDPRVDGAESVRRLRALGCAIAIVTLAEAGSLIDDGERQYRIPAYATDAKDPTGAGDTYLAGFLHAYLQDRRDLYLAGCTGAATASIWIEHTGPDAPITLAEVTRRVAHLLRLPR